MCIPFLFKEVVYECYWDENALPWDGFEQSVEALLSNEVIKTTIRYTPLLFLYVSLTHP